MEPVTAGILMIILLLVLLSIGLPIAFSLGVSGVICIFMVTGWETTYGFMSTTPFNTSASWLYVVLPLFILMGMLSYSAGINRDAFIIANNWLGRIKGGLAMATIGACSVLGRHQAPVLQQLQLWESWPYQRCAALSTAWNLLLAVLLVVAHSR